MSKVEALTSEKVLSAGLMWAGFDLCRQQRVCDMTNDQRFRTYYGSGPSAVLKVYEDLLEDKQELKLKDLLMAMYWLMVYPTEGQMAGMFKVCEQTARETTWRTICAIQDLKTKKVSLM